MKRPSLIFLALLVGALCAPLASRATTQPPINSYTAVELGSLGGGFTSAFGVNDAGQVVGMSYTSPLNGVQYRHAFRWKSGEMTDLGTLGGTESVASGINNSGQVAGWSLTSLGTNRACVWDGVGTIFNLGTLGGGSSQANAINASAQVVGSSLLPDGSSRAFLWKAGTMYDLGVLPGAVGSIAQGINASGQVAGVSWDGSGQRRAFRWSPFTENGTSGQMAALSSSESEAFGINGAGTLVGQAFQTPHAWDSTGGHPLPLLDTSADWYSNWSVYGGSMAAINNSQLAAGTAFHIFPGGEDTGTAYATSAVVWDPQNGTRSLDVLLGRGTVTNGSAFLAEARGINEAGQIAAGGYLLNPSPLPTQPLDLGASAGDGRITLTWRAGSGAATYTVQRADNSSGPFATVATGVVGNTYTDTSAVNGTPYYYLLSSANQYGESTSSNVASAVPMPPPVSPSELAAIPGDQFVVLSWNATAETDYYKVFRATSPGGPYYWFGVAYDATLEDYGDGDESGFYPLQNGVTYYYVVRAVNSIGESGDSNEASATPIPPPAPPAPADLTGVPGDRFVSLSWTAAPGANFYRVLRGAGSGGPYSEVGTAYGNTTYQDHSLANGTTYFYVVVAINNGGTSPHSSEVSVTPTGPPPPAAPQALSAAPAGKRRVSLRWRQSTSTGVVNNQVFRSSTDGGDYSLVATLSRTRTYTDRGLTAGRRYYYVVVAVDATGKASTYSNQASARPR